MRVNEIFYSLQGEGMMVGTPMVFVRLSGCNLRCPFCDTHHEEGEEMDEEEVVAATAQWPARWVLLTGGEPALQLTASLVERLHAAGKFVAVETNGTRPLPEGIDWITLSPKEAFCGAQGAPVLAEVSEMKVVYDGEHEPLLYPHIKVTHGRSLQPCDTGDPQRNAEVMAAAVEWVKERTEWRLSVQLHKLIGIK